MPRKRDPGLLSKLIHTGLRKGLGQAYKTVQIDQDKFLRQVRRSYGIPIVKWEDARFLDEATLAAASRRIISSSSKTAALEGMGLGIGGFTTVVPDMGILSAITLRMLQKLSLMHGFEYSTEEEQTALWVAVASAAGLDFTRDFVGKQAAERLVPRIIDAVAVKLGAEVAEKWVGRIVPVVSAGVAATLNYYFVRSWGRRAQKHFLDRHRSRPAHPALTIGLAAKSPVRIGN